MNDNKIQLVLQLLSQGFPEGKKHMDSLRTGAAELKSAVGSLSTAFKGLLGAIGGLSAGYVFKKALDQVIDYNKTLETSKLGIAAIITSVATLTDAQGRVLEGQEKFNEAQKWAVNGQQELQKIAMTTAATYTELVEVFQGILAPGLSAKMEFKEILDLTGLITNAVKAMGLPLNQIKQEARDLIQGGIQPASSSLAVALSINDAMVKKWREQGTMAKELTTRLQGFVYASREMENTWEGMWSNFKDVMQKALGESGKPVFEGLKSMLKDITESLVNIKRDSKGIIIDIQIKSEVKEKLELIVTILKNIAKAAVGVAAAFDITGTAIGEYVGTVQERAKALIRDPLGVFSKEHYKDIPGMDQTNAKIEKYAALLQRIDNIGKEKPKEAGSPSGRLKSGSTTPDPAKALVAQWEEIKYKQLQYQEEEKLAKAREEWMKADLEREQAYIEIKRSEAEVDAEIETRRDKLAVDRGELTQAEAVNREYERKVVYLERARDGLQELLNGMGVEVEYSEEGKKIGQATNKIQAEINKLLKERGIILEEIASKNTHTDDFGTALTGRYKAMVAEARTAAEETADAFLGAYMDIKGALGDLLTDSIHGFKNWSDIVTRLIESVLKRMIDLQLNQMMGPTASGGGLLGSIVSWFTGGGSSPGVNDMTSGWGAAGIDPIVNMFGGFHKGGMASEPTFYRLVPSVLFDTAPRLHGGIGPGERAAIIRDDEGVFTPGQMRALGLLARGEPQEFNVIINNNNGSDVSVDQTPTADGGVDITVLIDEAVGSAIASGRGKTYRAMQTMFGARPTLTRR